ncbi:calcium/sodium antiporter [Cyanobium sp. ATX 6A2]|uniref:calcium/sodium antiporter n=1 Tax=Cyanobium sp. ATX 6A2 TaxID=2823700 RepID=UPI0020CDD8A2|nr:calcium/sodium antiporter [Cyanobium sp. ATX 6A2]MCP9888229.1 calcium/sodium antiporter [Cyanobium sp. ATX 6A2]
MPLLPSLGAILAGIVVLFAGGELFVGGAAALALMLGIPQIVVGLTVVSLGTSAPELFVSLLALFKGGEATALAASNVVGSNIFNVLVVLGLSALVMPLRVRSRLVRRDAPLVIAVSMAVWGMASGGRLTWQAGLALLVGLAINMVWEIRTAREHPEETEIDVDIAAGQSSSSSLLKLALGLALLVLGSYVLVRGATTAAVMLGMSQTLIGLTIVAAGTSLPELVTSLVAAYRGSGDLAIGNVVGSNLMNLMLILGLSALASGPGGLPVDPVIVQRDLPLMVLVSLVCLPIFWTKGCITRREGALLAGLYVLYLTEQLLSSTAPWASDGYRQVVLVGVMPLVLVFLVWQVLAWTRVRQRS